MKLAADVIIVVSELDQAGVNMRKYLLELHQFEEKEILTTPDTWPTGEFSVQKSPNLSVLILNLPQHQILTDYLKDSLDAKLVIFASKHSSAAGTKALLTHVTGNWKEAQRNSGKDRSLALALPDALYHAYFALRKYRDKSALDEYTYGLEVSHHGPTEWDVPLIFMEMGGTEFEWADLRAAKAVAHAIWDVTQLFLQNNYIVDLPAFIGIGGTHYAPAFGKRVEAKMFKPGHMIPKYHIDALDEELLKTAWERTRGDNKIFLIDKKGTSGAQRKVLTALIEKSAYPWAYTTQYSTKKLSIDNLNYQK